MCNTNAGFQYFIRQSIKADERKVTNFGRADDRLSRFASTLLVLQRDLANILEADTKFDGGEFSIPAARDWFVDELCNAAEQHGLSSVENAIDQLAARTTGRFVYFDLGFGGV